MCIFWGSQCHSDRNTSLKYFHLNYTEGHLVQVLGLLYSAKKPPKENVSVLRGKRSWLQLLRDSFGSSREHLLQVWALPCGCGAVRHGQGTYCHSSSCCSASDSSVTAAFSSCNASRDLLHPQCKGWSVFVPSKSNIVIANNVKLTVLRVKRCHANVHIN